MVGTRIASFVRHNAIALVALFVALGGTGYAAVTINGANIKNGSIVGKKLRKHTLSGTQINVKKLGTVPAAKKATTASSATTAATAGTANNANSLGGLAAGDYLKAGCGAGTIDGYVEINGSSSMPGTYTTSSTYLLDAYDCSGQSAEVRRLGAGIYDIQFPGSPGAMAVASGYSCTSGEGPLCLASEPQSVTATYIREAGDDQGGFQIVIRNSEDGDYVDGAAYVVVP
jgi:hypothetical protein